MPRKLKVTIVGGGLSGLLAARVLREKHDVTILERFAGNHEFGAAITLGPTALHIVESLGFDRQRAGTIRADKVLVWNKNLVKVSETATDTYTKHLHSTFTFSYRIDLWNEFLRLATSDELPGDPARVLWNTDVVDADVETGSVRLNDGSEIECDLLIGADGIKSMLRPLVVQQDDSVSARPSGSSAFRFTLPAELVRQVFTRHGRTEDPLAANMNLYLSMDGTERTAVTYPCGGGNLLNFAFVVPDKLVGRETIESWTAEAEKGEIRRLFHDFHPAWLELADLGHEHHARCWRLRQHDPLPTYTRGRTFLIGDAAHTMTPHLGQGATQAIEDAAAFELFNDLEFDYFSVPEILHMMDRVRRERASRIQLWTREFQSWKKTALEAKYTQYCWTYPGIKTCLKRLDAGQDMIDLTHWRDQEEDVRNGQHHGGLASIPQAPPDTLFGMKHVYLADKCEKKVNLMVGAYRDDEGKPWKLPAVRKAEEKIFLESDFTHEYSPISGRADFNLAAQKLILGKNSLAIAEKRVCSFQTLSGTGAIHLGATLLARFLPRPTPSVYIPAPTWHLHALCFEHVGLPVKTYPYYSETSKSLDFDGLLSALRGAPKGSIVLLQACGHNPTGVDPTEDQWKQIASAIRAKALFPFLDCAYQGIATGSLTKDNSTVRLFAELGLEMVVAQSFSKSMGLYGQRVGCLHYVAVPGASAEDVAVRVASQLSVLVRSEISSPPSYGAKIAATVLNDEQLFTEWEKNLYTMSERLTEMRQRLREELERMQTPGTWNHITDQIGMFAFTGLTVDQCVKMREKHHIYMATTGRISVADLNLRNVKYVAEAIDDVIRYEAFSTRTVDTGSKCN